MSRPPRQRLQCCGRRSPCRCWPKYHSSFHYTTGCNYSYRRCPGTTGGAGAPCSPPQLCRSPLQITRKPKSGYLKLLGSPTPSSVGRVLPPVPPSAGLCCTGVIFHPFSSILLSSLPKVILGNISLLCFSLLLQCSSGASVYKQLCVFSRILNAFSRILNVFLADWSSNVELTWKNTSKTQTLSSSCSNVGHNQRVGQGKSFNATQAVCRWFLFLNCPHF